jgi:hypothetical protein
LPPSNTTQSLTPFFIFPTSPDFAGSLSTVDENNPTPAVHHRDSYFRKKELAGKREKLALFNCQLMNK